MATVAVTNAAGHMGVNMVHTLLDQGHTVRALIHRDQRDLQGLDIEVVHADVNDPDSLIRTFGHPTTMQDVK